MAAASLLEADGGRLVLDRRLFRLHEADSVRDFLLMEKSRNHGQTP
jgi:hypothetical protein